MRDILDDLQTWLARDEQVALATVVRTIGSSPRPEGARLAVTATGGIVGSVSAGCVEGAVIEACHDTMQDGAPRLLHFGVGDEAAWQVGMACGGTIDVYVTPCPAPAVLAHLTRALRANEPVVQATVVATPPHPHAGATLVVSPDGTTSGTLGSPHLQTAVLQQTGDLFQCDGATLRELPDAQGTTSVLLESFAPTPTLYIIGAVHIAIALVSFARMLGFRTVVIDTRTAFATPERFQHADELRIGWADEMLPATLDAASYVVVLAHDPKLDDPALQRALASPTAYIGALGSTRTNDQRRARLREAGFSAEQLARIHAPVGLPLGGRAPEEIALSIVAEITKVRRHS